MANITVLIASHLNEYRSKTIDDAIRSVINQGVKVLLSYSSDDEKYETALCKKYGIKYIKQSQFEHIKCMLGYVETDWVMFQDDDDMSHPDRITEMTKVIQNNHSLSYITCNAEYRNAYTNEFESIGQPDFACYCVKTNCLRAFFKTYPDFQQRGKYIDCLFMQYVVSRFANSYHVDKPLYIVRSRDIKI